MAAYDPASINMTKEEARLFRERWAEVNRREIEELRAATPELRLRQLATLMKWAKSFDWEEQLKAGEEEVRERWIRLKRHYGV